MSTDQGVVRAYDALISLYPGRFRAEYREDMVQLAREACADAPTWQVGARLLADLVISVPNQHLEVRMRKTPSQLVPLIYTALAVAGVLVALVGGTGLPLVIVGAVVAVVSGTAAVVAWRRVAPVGRSTIQTAHWWQIALTGPVLIAGVVLAAGAGVQAWELGMVAAGLGIVLTVTGLLLGIIRLSTHRPPIVPT